MLGGKAVFKLPVEDFRKAEEIFVKENFDNAVLISQYSKKKTKNEKVKYLRFMGYMETPEK